MRYITYILCLLWATNVSGLDSLKLKEVLIVDSTFKSPSTTLLPYESKTMSVSMTKVLEQNTPLILRSNGLGGVASIINRGMQTGQMQVYWNGIPINNNVVGLTDISIYNLSDFNSISLKNHAVFSAPGGVIQINSTIPKEIKNALYFKTSMGSFMHQIQQLTSVFSKKKVQINTQIGYESANNNFPYETKTTSGEIVTIRQTNASFKKINFSNSLYYNINNKNKLEIHNLWTKLDRQSPNPIGVVGQDAQLFDNVFITGLNYKYIGSSHSFDTKIAYYNSWIKFSQENANILSKTRLHKIFWDNEWKKSFNKEWVLSLLARHESNIVNSTNFDGIKYMQTTSIGAKIKYQTQIQHLEFSLLENSFKKQKPITSIYLKHYIKPLKSDKFTISYAVSRDVLFPTFNDQFWPVVGNEALKPQKGFKTELSTGLNFYKGESLKISTTITGYYQKLNNFISWSPDASVGGLWFPQNLQTVASKGLENQNTLRFQKNKWGYEFNTLYTFNQTENLVQTSINDISVNKQLIYRPKHSFRISNQVEFDNYFLQVRWSYFGNRNTIYSENPRPNKEFLPAYHMADISIGSLHPIKKWNLGWQFDINNLYNTKYQEVQNFAVPQNNFLFTLKIQYHNENN